MRGAALRSPTAIAAFKRGVLHAVGIDASDRAEVEARAYESCLENGDAAIGRAAFKEITAGQPVAWPARSLRLP
jgi:enoyl-CoA hydratase/carnithine racemase